MFVFSSDWWEACVDFAEVKSGMTFWTCLSPAEQTSHSYVYKPHQVLEASSLIGWGVWASTARLSESVGCSCHAQPRCSESKRRNYKEAGASSHTRTPNHSHSCFLFWCIFLLRSQTRSSGMLGAFLLFRRFIVFCCVWLCLWRVMFGCGVWYVPSVAAPFAGLNLYTACFIYSTCWLQNLVWKVTHYDYLWKTVDLYENKSLKYLHVLMGLWLCSLRLSVEGAVGGWDARVPFKGYPASE